MSTWIFEGKTYKSGLKFENYDEFKELQVHEQRVERKKAGYIDVLVMYKGKTYWGHPYGGSTQLLLTDVYRESKFLYASVKQCQPVYLLPKIDRRTGWLQAVTQLFNS